MTQKRAHVIYSGMVQGVGFRWSIQRIADSLGLTGWARNCPDGTVEVVCEGEEKNVNTFFSKVRKEMAQYIRSDQTRWENAQGNFDKFSIKLFNA